MIQEYLKSKFGTSFDNYVFTQLTKEDKIEVTSMDVNGHICNIEYTYTEDGEEYKYNRLMIEIWDVLNFIYETKSA